MEKKLIDLEVAYIAMFEFMKGIYLGTKSKTIAAALDDMATLPDGLRFNDAIWDDWVLCIEKAEDGKVGIGQKLPAVAERQAADEMVKRTKKLNKSEIVSLASELCSVSNQVRVGDDYMIAPELWKPLRGRGSKENPAKFIRRVYADYLGKGLSRAHIGQLDGRLYDAYTAHVIRNPEDRIEELLDRAQISAKRLKDSGISSRKEALQLRNSDDASERQEAKKLYSLAKRHGL